MPTYMFFDTETTGFPSGEPSTHPDQARVVQLSAVLTADDGIPRATLDVILSQSKDPSPGAAKVHGITRELIDRFGIPPVIGLRMFYRMAERADYLVAHNKQFDLKMLKIEAENLGQPLLEEHLLNTKGTETQVLCTMEYSTPIMKLAPTARMQSSGRGGMFKVPKLSEAHLFFCKSELEGAHNSLADAIGCKNVFFAIRRYLENMPTEDVDALQTAAGTN